VGRKRWVNHDLLPGMRRRQNKDGTARYYLDVNGKAIPLGSDYWKAVEKVKKVRSDGPQTIASELATWQESEDYKDLAEGTRKMYGWAIGRLTAVFGKVGFEDISKAELVKYVKLSSAKTLAKRDVACLSSMWSWAQREGRTKVENPRFGLEFKRRKAERTAQPGVESAALEAVKAHADPMFAFALDLLYLSGQDVGVVLGWKRSDIHWDEGVLDTTRRKTLHPIRIVLFQDGEITQFAKTLKAAMEYPRKVGSLYVISNDRGQPLTYHAFWQRFRTYRKKAGVTFELRAIRRQTATDADSLQAAQELLGHEDTMTTRRHYRRGEKVKPLK
jgi:integrase